MRDLVEHFGAAAPALSGAAIERFRLGHCETVVEYDCR